MIYIDNFTVNNDATKLLVSVSTDTGETITSAIVWNDSTYKNYDLAIDVSSLLTGVTNKEVFEIPASTLGVSSLDGIYFIEFQGTSEAIEESCQNCNNPLGVAASLNCFQECLLGKVLEYSVCNNFDDNNSCGKNLLCNILVIDMFITNLGNALEFGWYGEALDFIKALRKICNCGGSCEECGSCSDCAGLPTPSFKAGLNYGTLDGSLILV